MVGLDPIVRASTLPVTAPLVIAAKRPDNPLSIVRREVLDPISLARLSKRCSSIVNCLSYHRNDQRPPSDDAMKPDLPLLDVNWVVNSRKSDPNAMGVGMFDVVCIVVLDRYDMFQQASHAKL